MKTPDNTPLEISEGAWKLFGDPEAAESREYLPLYAEGMELLQRHRRRAARDPRPDWQTQTRVFVDGRLYVVILRTTWWSPPREDERGVHGLTMRFVPVTATGPGLLTFMCLEEEYEAILGRRPELRPWPRDN